MKPYSPFWGLIDDIKRKIVFYKSDLIDGLNLKCVASILYMYLVTLCSLVTFGGLLGQETDDSMVDYTIKYISIKLNFFIRYLKKGNG